MNKFTIYFPIFLCCLFLSTPLHAGSMSLTTYYPAPNGNYNKITTHFMQYMPTTLSNIKEQYKCSYDPADGLPACPAGLVYFDTDVHTLVVSDGTHWRIIPSMCVPLKACSPKLNCSSDDCGNLCGICPGPNTCSSSTPGIPGSCS